MIGFQGLIFILDAEENKVFCFTKLNDAPISTGGFGWAPGSFDTPTGLATDGVNIYVSDYGNHRIQRFDRQLNYISSFSTRDSSNLKYTFGYPLDVGLSYMGDIFILDGENNRVLKFNPIYSFERIFGNVGSGEGILKNPLRMYVDKSLVYLIESNRIVVFDYYGNYIRSIKHKCMVNIKGVALIQEGMFVCTDDKLLFFLNDRKLEFVSSVSSLIRNESIESVQDVAANEEELFILTPHRLHVLKIVR